MRTSQVSFIFLSALTAGAMAWPLSATADVPATTSSSIPQIVGGRPLTPEEMSQVRGAYSRVTIRVNGTTYEQIDPAATGSATLKIQLAPNTWTGGTSSTTSGGTSTSTVTISGVTFRTRTSP